MDFRFYGHRPTHLSNKTGFYSVLFARAPSLEAREEIAGLYEVSFAEGDARRVPMPWRWHGRFAWFLVRGPDEVSASYVSTLEAFFRDVHASAPLEQVELLSGRNDTTRGTAWGAGSWDTNTVAAREKPERGDKRLGRVDPDFEAARRAMLDEEPAEEALRFVDLRSVPREGVSRLVVGPSADTEGAIRLQLGDHVEEQALPALEPGRGHGAGGGAIAISGEEAWVYGNRKGGAGKGLYRVRPGTEPELILPAPVGLGAAEPSVSPGGIVLRGQRAFCVFAADGSCSPVWRSSSDLYAAGAGLAGGLALVSTYDAALLVDPTRKKPLHELRVRGSRGPVVIGHGGRVAAHEGVNAVRIFGISGERLVLLGERYYLLGAPRRLYVHEDRICGYLPYFEVGVGLEGVDEAF